MTVIEEARRFAERAHDGQTRKGAAGEPYATHLAEVAGLVTGWGAAEAVIAAAWLHDTVEDCDVTPAGILARFGADVAALVAEVTDDKTLPKAERKRLQVQNAPHKSPGAALIKVADKISNLRALIHSPPVVWSADRQAAYAQWAAEVVAGLPNLPEVAQAVFSGVLAEAHRVIAARATP